MSNAYSHQALKAASISKPVGCDPDGVVDNRPGISHPNMPRAKNAAKYTKTLDSRDLFSRHPQHGRDLVNNTHKAPGKQTDGKWVIGIGMRNPPESKPKTNRKSHKRDGFWTQDEEVNSPSLDAIEIIKEDLETEDI